MPESPSINPREEGGNETRLQEKERLAKETWRMLFADAVENELRKEEYKNLSPAQFSEIRNGIDSVATYSEDPTKDAEFYVKHMAGVLLEELAKREPK